MRLSLITLSVLVAVAAAGSTGVAAAAPEAPGKVPCVVGPGNDCTVTYDCVTDNWPCNDEFPFPSNGPFAQTPAAGLPCVIGPFGHCVITYHCVTDNWPCNPEYPFPPGGAPRS